VIPGSCVPHTTCCDDGDGEDAGGGDGLIWLYAVNIPPTATMTAAIPVRIPGKDVQNGFLLSSPIANFTIHILIISISKLPRISLLSAIKL
jgi:hypothetical protein